ncbi:MAG: HD domain-containing phosphohydrolase [Proteocatella sp.]
MKLLEKYISVFIIVMLFTMQTASYGQAQSKNYDKEILIVQSYQRDYEHTRELEKGIDDYFDNFNQKIRINYEFLDTKKDITEDNFKSMAEMMKAKYRNRNLDGVILCDDDALAFHIKYGEMIWPNVEDIVATGINSVKEYDGLAKDTHIIEELPDIEKTINIALEQNQNKNITTLNFIYDNTTTGRLMKNEVEALIEDKYTNYKTNQYFEQTPTELKLIIENSSKEELFFFVVYSRDRNGISYYYDEVPRYITMNSPNPIYGLWEFYMGTGIIGGYVASSYLYGQDAAKMMALLWEGKSLQRVEYEYGMHQKYIFDYNVLSEYKINKLPREAEIINSPESYFEKNKTLIIIFSIIISVLLTIIALLSFVIRQKNFLHQKNKEIAELSINIIDTQKDFISRLGDVIETRSHETANHVKRVAEVSRFLALKYGLSENEANILSIISPMHDIGKIGIPEEILHKRGKLTEREFEVMKYHTNIGYEILKSSDKEILKQAATVAFEHHEKWDGSGYPNRKKSEDIDIFARITAIVDVYDAVRSDRVYKKAWSFEEARNLIKEGSGTHFDPMLTALFLENIDEIEKIRQEINKMEKLEFNSIYNYIQLMAELKTDEQKN